MASEKEADQAREQHSDYLRDLGAHGITIDEIKHKGEKSFAVVAMFEKKPANMPAELELKSGNKTRKVPLVARVAPPFKPE